MPRNALGNRLAGLLAAIGVGAVFVAGLFVHGVVGAVLLIAVAVVLGYLSSQAWSSLHPRGRRFRLVVLVAVVAAAVVKIATS